MGIPTNASPVAVEKSPRPRQAPSRARVSFKDKKLRVLAKLDIYGINFVQLICAKSCLISVSSYVTGHKENRRAFR